MTSMPSSVSKPNGIQVYQEEKKQSKEVSLLTEQLNNEVQMVLQNSGDMRERAMQLHYPPHAAKLISCLTVLSNCMRDVSLVHEKMPAESFQLLKTPKSFRTCLVQVANRVCDAFRTADSSMRSIKAALCNMPYILESTLTTLGNPNDQGAESLLKINLKQIQRASEKCCDFANKTNTSFDEALKMIDELMCAITATSSQNEEEEKRLKILAEELKERKALLETEQQEAEDALREQREILESAQRRQRQANDQMMNLGYMFSACLTDAFMDSLHTVAQSVESVMTIPKNIIQDASRAAHRKKHGQSKDMTHCYENTLFKLLLQLVAVGCDMEITVQNKNEYTASIMAALQVPAKSQHGEQLTRTAAELSSAISRLSLSDENSQIEYKKAIEGARITCEAATEYFTKKSKSEKKIEEKAEKAKGMMQFMMGAATSANDLYDKERDRTEEMRKELANQRKQMGELLVKMRSSEKEEIDLTEVIEYLSQGLSTITDVKHTWEHMARFFDSIRTIVTGPMANNIEYLKDLCESGDTVQSAMIRRQCLTTGIKTCGICMEVANCADLYGSVSQKYVLPVITGVAANFALKKEDAQLKLVQLSAEMENDHQEVDEFIKKEIKAMRIKSEADLSKHANTFNLAITN